MNLQEVFLAIVSVLSALIIISVVVSLGWYIVWKIFLSRFKLVRELLGLINDSTPTGSSSSNHHSDKKDALLNKPTSGKARKVRRD